MQNDIDAAGWRAVGTCVPQIGAITAIRTTVDTNSGTDNLQVGNFTDFCTFLVFSCTKGTTDCNTRA
ncbi:unnamed protein product [Cylicostephanus goldi]|uniref:Uncharacterized protein n=1 Tax=Cylicostephanus goldi TaxID=71465 RepID=A0A3P6V3R6_CYLGO|nr:unnamed protein product [Cylicostephanus goldi]